MTIGTLVANLVQDTTTTTGTGAITLANTVPAGAPAGSTTFASAIAPTGVYPVNNVFYYISDGTNVEAGIGTLTSATNLSRDFVLYSANTPVIAIGNQSGAATHVNFAAGTKNVYSNPNLFAQTVALWARVPNQVGGGDGGLTEDLMSGTFTANIVINSVSTPVVVRYKVSSSGICTLTFPQTTATQAGTGVTITGIPAFLSATCSGRSTFLVRSSLTRLSPLVTMCLLRVLRRLLRALSRFSRRLVWLRSRGLRRGLLRSRTALPLARLCIRCTKIWSIRHERR